MRRPQLTSNPTFSPFSNRVTPCNLFPKLLCTLLHNSSVYRHAPNAGASSPSHGSSLPFISTNFHPHLQAHKQYPPTVSVDIPCSVLTSLQCQQAIQDLDACHKSHPFSKFFGACNKAKAVLDKCLCDEYLVNRELNAEKSRISKLRLKALIENENRP